MKPNRLNLCQVIREALINDGYSPVKVTEAVNAQLGKLTLKSTENKTGDGKMKEKGLTYAVSVTGTFKYQGPADVSTKFDAWHSVIAKAEKLCSMPAIELPIEFIAWLDGFAKKPEEKPADDKKPEEKDTKSEESKDNEVKSEEKKEEIKA